MIHTNKKKSKHEDKHEAKSVAKPEGNSRHIPFVETKYFDIFNTTRKSYALSWNEVFKRFALYKGGIEYIFSAPGEMTKQLTLDHNTVMGLIDTWINNIRLNWTSIHTGNPVSDLAFIHEGKTAITIGAGPSLKIRKHLEYIKSLPNRDDYVIISTAHSLVECLENGVVPDFCSFVDASDKMLPFISHPLVDQYAPNIKMVFIASTHPDVIERWAGEDNYYFLSGIPQNLIPNVDTFLSTFLPDLPEMDSGGNSGSFCVSLASYVGCKTIAMVGMDLSHPVGFPHKETQYFSAYCRSIGSAYKDKADVIKKAYTVFHHPIFNTDSYYDFVYDVFRDALNAIAKYNAEAGVEIINCTEGGIVGSEHIKCMKLVDFINNKGV